MTTKRPSCGQDNANNEARAGRISEHVHAPRLQHIRAAAKEDRWFGPDCMQSRNTGYNAFTELVSPLRFVI